MGAIRVGFVRAGNWARYGHLPVLRLLPQFQVTAVQARRRPAAESAAAEFGVARVADTVEELVGALDVDLVAVLSTAPQHAEAIHAAVAVGKHVYSEWPLTVSPDSARGLLTAAETAGVRHFVGLQRRLAPITATFGT